MRTQTKEKQTQLTPDLALDILKEGNERFVKNLQVNRNLLEQVKEISEGQYPFAVILSCIDSKAPSEFKFDPGIGDIFSIRVAGNFINEDILGSMEFACKVAGSMLIVILGYSSCGAIKGACDHVKLGNLTGLLDKIQPAVNAVNGTVDRTSANKEFVQQVASKNVEFSKEKLTSKSSVLREMIESGEVGLVGGMYSVETGCVEFS
ncbi:MAG: carbonic anhydrase [Cytophagales bacterium]|nr:carbonic anhydrase [Cytophagales bacterium]